jgi:fructosamine-3-kinase
MTGTRAGSTFTKRDPAAPEGFFEAEARGLRWLGEVEGGANVVAVLDVSPSEIVLQRLHHVTPSPQDAEDLGRRLARTHEADGNAWGRADGEGFIGPLHLPNGPFGSWHEMWWRGRVEPYLRASVDRGLLSTDDAAALSRAVQRHGTALPTSRPARIHGDLWSGNVVWTSGGGVLIDAASAHGGHPDADLAMLELFGLDHLGRLRSAYHELRPLADGWRERKALFWLHPLLVHVVLFGSSYVGRTRRVVQALT